MVRSETFLQLSSRGAEGRMVIKGNTNLIILDEYYQMYSSPKLSLFTFIPTVQEGEYFPSCQKWMLLTF